MSRSAICVACGAPVSNIERGWIRNQQDPDDCRVWFACERCLDEHVAFEWAASGPRTTPHPRALEDAAIQLALAAEDVDGHIMDSGLAWRRERLRAEIDTVKALVERHRADRTAK